VLIICSSKGEAQTITPKIAEKLGKFCLYYENDPRWFQICSYSLNNKYGINSRQEIDKIYYSLANRRDIAADIILDIYRFYNGNEDWFYRGLKDWFTIDEIETMEKICRPIFQQEQREKKERDSETKKQQEQGKSKYLENILSCEDFVDGLAWVGFDIKYLIGEERNDYWSGYRAYGLINLQGEFIIEPQYVVLNKYRDTPLPTFVEGFALVQPFDVEKSHKFIFIDQKGNNVFNKKFSAARNFSEGYAGIKADNGKWGFIDKNGNLLFEPKYDVVGDFKDGIAPVGLIPEGMRYASERDAKWGYIDNTGKEIIYPQFSEASPDFAHAPPKTILGINT